MNTDGNMDAIERHLADCEEHDAWQDLQDQLEAARADAKEAEAYAEELERDRNALFRRVALAEEWRDHDKIRADEAEAKLEKIELIIVKRIKFHQSCKDAAGSGSAKQREHHRVHALSEVLGEIRKSIKEEIEK